MSERRDRRTELEALRVTAHEIIFKAETPAGKWFDVALIVSIVLSVAVVMLESVAAIRVHYGAVLTGLEWFFTGLFTVEYVVRIISATSRLRYATSFFGVVDLLAILPTFLSLVLPGSQYLVVIRVLRILRIFRVLKLVQFLSEMALLRQSLARSWRKIVVFLFIVAALVTIFGSLMYLIEGPENGFTSIPRSIYWAIVTLTTVGYGDISPGTGFGQFLSAVVMILGYSIIVVPTGFVTVELTRAAARARSQSICPACDRAGHDDDARHCKHCGSLL
jgi:voltage-gated potassium channel